MQATSTNSVFGLPPASPRPQADAAALNEIFNRTKFGAIKATIGSDHHFVKKVPIKLKTIDKATGKVKEIDASRDELDLRKVYSTHQYPLAKVRWMALGTDITADDEDELLAKVYAKFGTPELMHTNGVRVVYCAETIDPVEVHRVVLDPKTYEQRSDVAYECVLLSDRAPTSHEGASHGASNR